MVGWCMSTTLGEFKVILLLCLLCTCTHIWLYVFTYITAHTNRFHFFSYSNLQGRVMPSLGLIKSTWNRQDPLTFAEAVLLIVILLPSFLKFRPKCLGAITDVRLNFARHVIANSQNWAFAKRVFLPGALSVKLAFSLKWISEHCTSYIGVKMAFHYAEYLQQFQWGVSLHQVVWLG